MDEQQQEFYREQHEINRGFIARLDAMAIESAESRKRDAALAKVIEKLLYFVNDMGDRVQREQPPMLSPTQAAGRRS